MSTIYTFSQKKFIPLLICFLFLATAANTQMRQIYLDNTVQDNDLNKMSFYSRSAGYVGFRDWIGYTTDSGRTFLRKYVTLSNVDYNGYSVNLTFGFTINGVKAFSQNNFLAYGDYGLVPAILSSTDGGSTFKLIYHSQFNNLQLSTGITDMIFPQDNTTGYAVDADRVLKTTNGGLNWTVSRVDPGSFFTELTAVDNNAVFAFSTEYSTSKLVKTTNGGTNWQSVTIPSLPSPGHMTLTSVYYRTSTKGWLSMEDDNDNYYFYTTDNGGSSWTLKNNIDAVPFAGKKIKFFDDNNGYAIRINEAVVYKTDNGGVLWEPLLRDNNNYGSDLQFWDNNQFWAGGGSAFIEITTNAGGGTLPKAYFRIDTNGVVPSGTVNLLNYSRTGYQYKWYANNVLVSTSYNATYSHFIGSYTDSIKLVVTNNGVSDSVTKYHYFNVPPLPTITSFLPETGSTGTFITITGSNFTGVTGVSFGAVPAASFTIVSPTKITAVVAGGATGNVSVTDVFGTYPVPGFTYFAPPVATAPVINSFGPASGVIGTPVTINGNNFDPTIANNIIHFGAVRATVTAASPTQLTCTVPMGASYEPISVFNATTRLSASSLKPFNVVFADSNNFTTHSFVNAHNINVGVNHYPKAVTGADIDGDGKPDIVATVEYSVDSVLIYRNTSTGGNFSFEPKVAIGSVPTFGFGKFSVIDLDGDDKPEVIVATNYAYINIYRNTSTPGTISFMPGISFPSGTGDSQDMTVDDIDNDGRPDILVPGYGNNKVTILRNTSSLGYLSFGAPNEILSGGLTLSVATGDLDGDGKKDMVSLNYGNPVSSFSFFKNLSTIASVSFSAKTDISVPGVSLQGRDIKLADYDGDDKLDVIILDDNNYAIFRNTSTAGTISFAAITLYPINGVGQAASVANLSGDAKPDLVSGHWGSRRFTIYRNVSVPGTIATDPAIDIVGDYPYNTVPYYTNTGDFNMDGKADIIVGASPDYLISIFKNNLGAELSFSLCAGGSSSIIADIPGTSYQWQMNSGSGFTDISDNANFSGTHNSELQLSHIPFAWNGRQFRCIVNGFISSKFNMQVTDVALPDVTISTPVITICAGTLVTFTSTVINPGNNTGYQWEVNGVYTGTNTPTYSTNGLNNNSQVRLILVAYDACFNQHLDTSNVITMTVNGGIPSVTISTPSTTICGGTTATFTATPVNGGAATYQWKLNGVNAGTNSTTFTPPTLNNNDVVSVVMTASGTCISPDPVFSNSITMAVQAASVPSVSINTPQTSICQGTTATFTAVPVNGGTTPSYQWQVNNANVGSNSSTYSSAALGNNAQVKVILTSNAVCASPLTGTSNIITMVVKTDSTPTIIISGTTTIVQGQSSSVTSVTTNTGSNAIYKWQDSTAVHSWQDIAGATNATLIYTPLATGNKLRCIMTSTAGCVNPTTVTSNALQFTITTVTVIDPVPGNTYGIRIYPNPVSAVFTIDTLKIADRWQTIEITSADGKHRLQTKTITNQSKVSMDVSALPGGLYFAILRRKSGEVVYLKFVKQ